MTLRVAVVGGGIGGVAAALFLQRVGIAATVNEQTRELRETGAGLVVPPNMVRLLDEPELVHAIVCAVRRAVPAHIAVSAKMRLGHRDDSRMVDCAQAIEAAGASELVVHARTKLHGYKPPAYWDRVALIRAAVRLPVVANGEVWTVADARRCLAESGCDALMLGRGLVSDPGLALALRGRSTPNWNELLPFHALYSRLIAQRVEPRHRGGRIKQWLNMLRRRFPQAQVAYDAVRALQAAQDIDQALLVLQPEAQSEAEAEVEAA